MRAEEFAEAAAKAILARAKFRDTDEERAIDKAVAAFNVLTGHAVSVDDYCMLMMLIKVSRSRGGRHHRDDLTDTVGYAGLWAEAVDKRRRGVCDVPDDAGGGG